MVIVLDKTTGSSMDDEKSTCKIVRAFSKHTIHPITHSNHHNRHLPIGKISTYFQLNIELLWQLTIFLLPTKPIYTLLRPLYLTMRFIVSDGRNKTIVIYTHDCRD